MSEEEDFLWAFHFAYRPKRVTPIGKTITSMTEDEATAADMALAAAREGKLCSDCPPPNWPTDKTRCGPCPRRPALEQQ